MNQHTIAQISINDIVREAGVSRQSVYRHFGSKSNIKRLFSDDEYTDMDTRKRILQAASQTFARTGYAETSLDQVANEAGFTKGAIYGYFSSKSELFLSLLQERIEQQLKWVPEAIQNALLAKDPVTGLDVFFKDQFMDAESDPDWPRLFLEFSAHSRKPEIQHQLSEAYTVLQDRIRNLIIGMQHDGHLSSKVDATVLTAVTKSLLDGLVMDSLLYPDQIKPISWSRQIARILWEGIAPKKSE